MGVGQRSLPHSGADLSAGALSCTEEAYGWTRQVREHNAWPASVPLESFSCSMTWAVIDDIMDSKLDHKILKMVPATM